MSQHPTAGGRRRHDMKGGGEGLTEERVVGDEIALQDLFQMRAARCVVSSGTLRTVPWDGVYKYGTLLAQGGILFVQYRCCIEAQDL